MKPFNVSLTVLPLLLLISCASPPQATTQDKKAELCTNLAKLNTSVATLKSMSPSSTVGDFRNAQEQVKVAYNNVKTSAQNVQEAKAADLDRAYSDLEKSMKSVPNNATLKQASQSVSPKIAAVEAAQAQMQSGLNCP